MPKGSGNPKPMKFMSAPSALAQRNGGAAFQATTQLYNCSAVTNERTITQASYYGNAGSCGAGLVFLLGRESVPNFKRDFSGLHHPCGRPGGPARGAPIRGLRALRLAAVMNGIALRVVFML